MTVYVDVLLAINIFVNYLLLVSARRILRLESKTLRTVIAAGVGSLYSLIIFLPKLPEAVKLATNIAVIVLMLMTAFAPKSFKAFLKLFFAFLGVNFIFAGLMLALWIFVAPEGMLYNNSVVYFDIDIKLLIVLSLACYLVLRLITTLVRRTVPKEKTVSLSLTHCGKCVTVNALIDTGNSLKDSFSGAPVMIADGSVIRRLTGESLYTLIDTGRTDSLKIRLIPVNTVSSDGLIAAFRVDGAMINNSVRLQNILLAQSKSRLPVDEYSVILNNDFLSQGETIC